MSPRRTECYSVTVLDFADGDWADIDTLADRYIAFAALQAEGSDEWWVG